MSEQEHRRLKPGEVRLRLHVEQDMFDCMVQPTPRKAVTKGKDAWLTPAQLAMWSRLTGTVVSGRASRQSVRMNGELEIRSKMLELWPNATVTLEHVKDNVWTVEIINKIPKAK